MSSAKNYKIAVLPGDGTGPEVVREGLKVLEAVSKKTGFKYEKVMYDLGGERYKKTKEVLPDSVLDELRKVDVIYLGAVGHPDVKPGILEKGLLLKLRFSLEQYINLRPVKLYPGVWTPIKDKEPKDIDFVVRAGCLPFGDVPGVGAVVLGVRNGELVIASFEEFDFDIIARIARGVPPNGVRFPRLPGASGINAIAEGNVRRSLDGKWVITEIINGGI